MRVLELFFRWVQSGFSNELPPKADLIVPFFKIDQLSARRIRLHHR